jgi:GNAT superfamily N-acetyltransferase
MAPALTIRLIDPASDRPSVAVLHRLILELADYEKLPVTADADALGAALVGAQSTSAALAELDGEAIGYLVWYRTFSTFRAAERVFLEDLYVTPAHRGHGHGRAMLAWLARLTRDAGLTAMQWQVLDWNTPAIRFYESLGTDISSTWLDCRLEGPALDRLAAHSQTP